MGGKKGFGGREPYGTGYRIWGGLALDNCFCCLGSEKTTDERLSSEWPHVRIIITQRRKKFEPPSGAL